MAELLPKGKQPATRRPPSRLRHEVHIESTDYERAPEDMLIQAPDSQTVVPETRFEETNCGMDDPTESDYGEPLTPTSAAVVVKLAAEQGPKKSEPSPFAVRLFSKDAFSSQPEVRFSFSSHMRKPAQIAPTTDRVKSSQAVIEAPAVGMPSTAAGGIPNDGNPFVSNTDAPQALHDAHHDVPPFAQPVLAMLDGAKKTRTAKKGKKGKRSLLAQQRGAPWPPRSSSVPTRAAIEPPATKGTVTIGGMSEPHTASFPVEGSKDRRGEDTIMVADTAVTPVEIHEAQIASHPPQGEDELGAKSERQPVGVLQPAQQVTHGSLNDQSQRQSPTITVKYFPGLPFDESLPVESQAVPKATHNDRSEVLYGIPNHEARDRHGLKRTKLQHVPKQQPQQLQEPQQPQQPRDDHFECHDSDAQLSFPPKSPVRNDAHQRKPTGAVTQVVSSHAGPYRVEKTSRKKVVSGSQFMRASAMTRNRAPAVHVGFESIFENLRNAYITEKRRQDEDLEAQNKNFEEVKALLQDQINQYSITVVEWKERYDGLNANVVQLRDKAKTNQRYVTGLQKDYEKLQKSTLDAQNECKKVLQHKIAEIESEKESLRRDFESTMDTVAKGQKAMRSTVEDLYVRLTISESKRKDLAENMSKQVAMFEEEKTKRNELEKQLLSSVHSVQRQLGDQSTQLVEKVESLQKSVESAMSEDEKDASAAECLTILREFQGTPFVTAKDLKKAEGMLRFVHDGIGTKLNTLVQSVESQTYPTEDIQTFVKDRLQELRSEILRFDEVVAESRKAQESNDTLQQQLQSEQQQTQQLTEQMGVLRQNEDDLKARQVQLERQLADMGDKTQDQGANSTIPEQETVDLRKELGKVKDELSHKEVEIAKLERNLEKRDRKLADFEKSYTPLKDRCEKLTAKLKQIAEPSNELENARNSMLKELQQGFVDKETAYKNDVHRLTIECDDMKALIQQHENQKDAARARVEEARREASEIRAELKVIRSEKNEAEKKATSAQQMVLKDSSNASEITSLKERLRQKAERLQSKIEEYTELEQAFTQLQDHKKNLVVLCEQQQAEISQHPSAIESLREEHETERTFEQESAQAAVQRARNEVLTLQKQKEQVRTKLEECQVRESRLSNAQAALTTERDDLRNLNTEIRLAKEAGEAQLVQIQEQKSEEVRLSEERMDTLRREQERSDAALKEAEAKIRRQDAEYHKKIEFDRERYAARVEGLIEELEEAKATIARSQSVQQQDSQVSVAQSGSLQNIHAGRNRKKVNREPHSTLYIAGASISQVNGDSHHPPAGQREATRDNFRLCDGQELLFDGEFPASDVMDDSADDQGLSIIDPAAEPTEDTQDAGGISMSNVNFIEHLSSQTLRISKQQVPASTSQSSLSESMGEEDLEKIRKDAYTVSRPVLRGHDLNATKLSSSQDRVLETPMRSFNESMSVSQSSHSPERPRSQANTASRMMPPPGKTSRYFGQGNATSRTDREDAGPHSKYGKLDNTFEGNQGSSPDYMHSPSSATKHTYAQHGPEVHGHNGQVRGSSQVPEQFQSQKRKSSFGQDVSYKKQRASSQSLPEPSSGSQTYSPYPIRSSAAGVRSRHQASPSLQPASSIALRPRAQASSSGSVSRPSSRNNASGDRSRPRNQQSSTSRSSGRRLDLRQPASSRQTRSKSILSVTSR
ncbi:hypothetical protein CC86DRAFT_383251 [Ophiobolus disseminans]|uniref:Uncharacterized protein n=1 Tax=Ophiobolus disseminans TaxID=1469910 RepID=A0A6A6ZWB1_9PLEO|nr:hypothetical protein CC86DRAFT_383251 [Ophiobolus disseminans]